MSPRSTRVRRHIGDPPERHAQVKAVRQVASSLTTSPQAAVLLRARKWMRPAALAAGLIPSPGIRRAAPFHLTSTTQSRSSPSGVVRCDPDHHHSRHHTTTHRKPGLWLIVPPRDSTPPAHATTQPRHERANGRACHEISRPLPHSHHATTCEAPADGPDRLRGVSPSRHHIIQLAITRQTRWRELQ